MISDEVSCSSQSNVNPGIKGQKTEWLRHPTTIVRAGDVLVASDETRALLANLEGVALSNGSPGEVIGVRLRLGGNIMRAQVLAPGKVRLIAAARQAR
jgi:flagella basal body P-ring formation protein FlgA